MLLGCMACSDSPGFAQQQDAATGKARGDVHTVPPRNPGAQRPAAIIFLPKPREGPVLEVLSSSVGPFHPSPNQFASGQYTTSPGNQEKAVGLEANTFATAPLINAA